jgi:FAD/FMN-containing dehydrogenase
MTTVSIKTLEGDTAELERAAIDNLNAGLCGTLLMAGDPGYDEARSIWNGMIDRRPALIAQCIGVADVVTCVNFARSHGISLSMKSGGHNIAGLAVCDGGLMIDLSLMRGVRVDPATRTAHAQAGCLLGDIDRETQLHGLAAALGFVSKTGAAGLTLGGGFGYLARQFGWACDNVLSMDIVTAEGQVVRASESENPDLFWGLRGGGGNFGVVTNFEHKLYPIGPEILGGAIAWRGEDAPSVLELFRKVTAEAPPELTCVAVLRYAPPAPWLPEDVHGKPIIALFVCDSGKAEEAEKRIAPIKSFGAPVGDVIQRRAYTSQQSMLDATQPNGRRYYWESEYLPGHEPEMLAAAVEHAAGMVSPHSAILLFPLDGATNELPDDHCPADNRDAKTVINIAASWDSPADDDANIAWARAAWQDMRRFSTGGTYVNFLTEEQVGERVHAAYRNNYERLVDIKTKWDPTNLFRMNKNIPPRQQRDSYEPAFAAEAVTPG